MSVINIKQEIGSSKALINKYKNQLANCYNIELKQQLEYKLQQEQLKLESYELLLGLYQKVGYWYE